MIRSISRSLILAGLVIAPLMAQTAAPPARRGTPPPTTAKPIAKPAAPAAPTAKPAAPAVPASNLPSGTYAHFATSMGAITVHLFDKDAPKTVANFVGLATGKKGWTDPRTRQLVHRPYYNNLTFHRVIANFMIQAGDPLGNGTGGPGFEFADEFSPNLHHDKVGIMSMANHGPNTNGAQFFITVSPALTRLDNHYSIFGEVIEGMDIVMAISAVAKDSGDKPLTPVVIKTVRIETVP